MLPFRSGLILLSGRQEVRIKPWPKARFLVSQQNEKGRLRIRLGEKRIELITGVDFLHCDIRTPFGEEVNEDQVEAALQSALGPKRESYHLRGWHILHVEDTHVGSVHRLWVTLDFAEKEDKVGVPADYRLPLELALMGLGRKVNGSFAGKPWQMLFRHEESVYSLLFHGDSVLHVRSFPATGENILARAMQHYRGIGLSENPREPEVRVLGPGLDWPLPPQVAPEAWLRLTDLLPQILPLESSPEKALALGICAALENPSLLAHDRIREEEGYALRAKRLARVCLVSVLMAISSSLLGAAALGFSLNQAKAEKQMLQLKAAGHQKQVLAMQQLRNLLQARNDSLQSLGLLARNPYPASLILGRLAAAADHGGLLAMQMRQEEDGHVDLRLKAWTSSWEKVEGFRGALAKMPQAQSAEVMSQKKESGQGKVQFDLALQLVNP